jgi:hypothetical protein
MSKHREKIYVRFVPTGEMLEMASVQAAKAFVAERYPGCHFGEWETGQFCTNLPVWESTATRLRYDLGETQDEYKPVAYVILQQTRLEGVAKIGE